MIKFAQEAADITHLAIRRNDYNHETEHPPFVTFHYIARYINMLDIALLHY